MHNEVELGGIPVRGKDKKAWEDMREKYEKVFFLYDHEEDFHIGDTLKFIMRKDICRERKIVGRYMGMVEVDDSTHTMIAVKGNRIIKIASSSYYRVDLVKIHSQNPEMYLARGELLDRIAEEKANGIHQ